jgi:hypothetical protein
MPLKNILITIETTIACALKSQNLLVSRVPEELLIHLKLLRGYRVVEFSDSGYYTCVKCKTNYSANEKFRKSDKTHVVLVFLYMER